MFSCPVACVLQYVFRLSLETINKSIIIHKLYWSITAYITSIGVVVKLFIEFIYFLFTFIYLAYQISIFS